MVSMFKCLLLLRTAGCENGETVNEFVGEEQRSLLRSFMALLEAPSLMSNRLYEKLEERYSKEYCNRHVAEFYHLSWWIYDVHHSVRARKLREVVRERILELGGAIRSLYSASWRVHHDEGDSCFCQILSLSLFNEEADVSRLRILEEARDKIADRTAEILVAAHPRDLFSDGVFEQRRTHRGIRRVIVKEAIEIIEGMADDDRLGELLDRMMELTVEYYEKVKGECAVG